MKRYLTLLTLFAVAILLMAPLAFAANPNSMGEPDVGQGRWATSENGRVADNGEVVYRCGTDERGRAMHAPDKAEIDRYIQENRIAAGGVIPVNFHVIYSAGEGNVPEAWLDAQILVLNRNYAGRDYNGNVVSGAANTGYTFVKASVTRTNSRKWFRMTPGSAAEAQAKSSLRVNPTSSLNFYTCKPGQNLLGWATFPWNLAGNPNMDGVVVHYASLPGGSLAPYNLGGTGSHEVGHWVGLYHTFQGGCGTSDCAASGDLVCDTPAQGTATSGCPNGKDTCAGAGLDPIHNYMDYSTDICYTNFTPGQDARADFMMGTYRPAIGSARLADAELADGDFRAGEEHGKAKADNGEEVYRCASDHRGANLKGPKKSEIDQWVEENGTRVAAGGVIPVNVHVIYSSREGNVTDQQIAAQIAVLNNNFAGRDYNGNVVSGAANTGYTFVLNSVTRTNNRKWLGMTPGSSAEAQAKAALVVNPTGSLNLYTCKPGQNLLGWATFPWSLAGNPTMDGVVIHYASLPGGALAPYNLGGTGSHEVGHWVGLLHTFQGGCGTSDCAASGDQVCDTPAQGTATSGCPNGKDTCAGAGLDPIHNYMDYSTDICYTNFTSGQDARADFMMATYRPVVGSAARTQPTMASSVRELSGGLVEFKARPNPFNPRTKIEFGLARDGRASVRVFDIQGRLVATVVDRALTAGNHTFDFDAGKLSSGVYFMRLEADGTEKVRRLSLLK